MHSPSKIPPISPHTSRRLHGLIKENEWYCNCEPRDRAVRLQVKKEGPNRGRWFYKCPKPWDKRCSLFLWQEDAEPREREVEKANSNSELDPRTQTQTPTKSFQYTPNGHGLLTPQTERRVTNTGAASNKSIRPPSTPLSAKARMMAEDTDEFSWDLDSEDNAELTQALSQSQPKSQRIEESFISQPNFRATQDQDTPNKAPRTPKTPSPGKRKLSEYAYDQSNSTSGSSILATPSSSHSFSFSSRIPPASAEVCMTPTPTKYRDGDVLSADSRSDASELAQELLAILDKHEVVIPNAAKNEVVSWVNREDKKYKGAVRARDMLRGTLKKKDGEIMRLQEKITNLKAQTELDNSMIESFES
ncbi:Zinc finger GRF-type [Penicillium angulare]|uniref:Zinc finger GRF-type n=1 Tax=Penicillium angulare TaxID=116970 RepID=A0A9W9GCI5_9EURO|nr:Zinc finger GRF-type [Penicillium angulare]